mmetsp:Transcript_10000/g.16719  ORF Transcript_10000/g.16719 Transcript_10000/m.16719 type:complete len:592 (+) Transcript_10000:240-2015(+)
MGPSGAGKTSLLKVLTMDAPGGISSGVLTLNGQPLTASRFKRRCALVGQEDHHWAFLTCKETIRYAADLYMPISKEEKDREVDNLVAKMGLDSCADTLVGSQFMKGLSGGQMRRLSLAVILLKKLDVVILDEPTSGLDAASAASIMTFVSELTKSEGLISLYTIHQPSTLIYETFDRVMLLSAGRIAYCGSRENVLPYFAQIKNPVPPQTNPAEFMLDLVNKDFSDEEKVNAVLDAWDREGDPDHQKRIQEGVLEYDVGKSTVAESDYQVSLLTQIVTMFRRHTLLAFRDPTLYSGRAIVFLFVTIFFAIIYIRARERAQDQIISRMFYCVWIIGVPSCMGVIAVFAYNTEFNAIRREVKNGMVSPLSYLLANTVLTIPVMFLFAIAATGIGAYAMLDFNGERFGQVMLTYALLMFAYESMAQFFCVLSENPLLGMMNFMNSWFASFLFSGLFIVVEDIVWPFRVFAYVLPLRYALAVIVYQEFSYETFKGAVTCDPSSSSSCMQLGSNSGANEGYACTDSDTENCFGRDGWQVMYNLAEQFDALSRDNITDLYLIILIAIAVFCKIGYVVIMAVKSNAITHIQAAAKKEV